MGWLDFWQVFKEAAGKAVAMPRRASILFSAAFTVTDNEAENRTEIDVDLPVVTTSEAGLAPQATGNDKVLTTNGSGVATWINKSSFGASGKTLLSSSVFETGTYADVAGGYTAHSLDDNPVLVSENVQVMAHPGHVCVSATSKLHIFVGVNFTPNSAGTTIMAALHNGGNALRVASGNSATSGYPIHLEFSCVVDSPGAGSTYSPTVRMGQVNGSGEFYFNGNSSGRRYGGGMVSSIRIEEFG